MSDDQHRVMLIWTPCMKIWDNLKHNKPTVEFGTYLKIGTKYNNNIIDNSSLKKKLKCNKVQYKFKIFFNSE